MDGERIKTNYSGQVKTCALCQLLGSYKMPTICKSLQACSLGRSVVNNLKKFNSAALIQSWAKLRESIYSVTAAV